MANIIVVGPHPDDQEAGMGGTVALLASQGHRILLLDMTSGEPTPLGDPVTRSKEAAAAARLLSPKAPRTHPVERRCIGLPNRQVTHSLAARHAVAKVIREWQASILFVPFFEDAHPDHLATTRIVEDARFDAKLSKMRQPGQWRGDELPAPGDAPGPFAEPPDDAAHPPIYPKWLFYYYATHLRWCANPNFLMDITGHLGTKLAAIRAYESQFVRANAHVVDWIEAAAVYFGSRAGCTHAEPFFTKEPLGLASLAALS